jgi:hypothetical protein
MSIGYFPIGLVSLGQIPPAPPVGGATTSDEQEPPEGYRRVLDTRNIDIAARRRTMLDALRKEIGLVREQPAVIEAIRIPPPPEIDAPEPEPLPLPPAFDEQLYAASLVRIFKALDAEEAEIEEANTEFLLLAAAIA